MRSWSIFGGWSMPLEYTNRGRHQQAIMFQFNLFDPPEGTHVPGIGTELLAANSHWDRPVHGPNLLYSSS